MHFEAENRKKAAAEERERRQNLKIRKVLRKGGRKIYALILVDDLVVTDDWNYARQLIDEETEKGRKVRYKGFPSLDSAYEYLRNG